MSQRPSVLVLGASANPARYSNMAATMLTEYGYPIVPVGLRQEEVAGTLCSTEDKAYPGIDTITLYVGPAHQSRWLKTMLETAPRRMIMNPGTENEELAQKASEQGIEVVVACTLVMLRTGQF